MIHRTAFLLIGLTATVAQILVLRELLVVYYGNEISLGVTLATWLIWVAFGSGVLGRLLPRTSKPERRLAFLQILAAIVLPSTIMGIRLIRPFAGTVPGEIVSPATMLVSSLFVLALFCSISGAMFPTGSQLYSRSTGGSTAEGTSSIYLLEAIGSGVGGLLASLFLIQNLSSLQIVVVLSLLNLVCAIALMNPKSICKVYFWFSLLVIAFFIFGFALPQIESQSLRIMWGSLRVLDSRNSAHGNLTLIQNEDSKSLFVNSLVAFTRPDPESAEESVHLALLQHPNPQKLLMIGGGFNGSLEQSLQHSDLQQIDYVELDPEVYRLARQYFPDGYSVVERSPRIDLHRTDGRLFLRMSRADYDVIIVNLPDPKTAQLNRFYTLEFFQETERKLSSDGILAFQLTGAENYISDELAAFLGCIHRTLEEAFPEVVVFPGGRVHFFAAKSPGTLSADPATLMGRLRARQIETQYVREYYFPFRLMPDRLEDLETQLRSQLDPRINKDFSPIAYYFDMLFWSSHFDRSYPRVMKLLSRIDLWIILALVLAVSVAAPRIRFVKRQAAPSKSRVACCCVWAMGFTMLALEILLLFGFQAVYGYVYHRLALIVAAFMVGMALGSWLSRRAKDPADSSQMRLSKLFWIQLAAALLPILVSVLLVVFTQVDVRTTAAVVSAIAFPILAFLSGFLGGYQFPLASYLFYQGRRNRSLNSGLIYGLDILGACCASLLVSILFFPLYGLFATALLIAAVNAGPILWTSIAAFGRFQVGG